MSDLLNPLELVPALILLAGIVTTVVLARRHTQRRLRLILGTYLLLVALAVVFALTVRDEFGFSFLPALILTGPWQWLLPRFVLTALTPSFGGNHYGIFWMGATLNCVLLSILYRLSYPKHSAGFSDPHAT